MGASGLYLLNLSLIAVAAILSAVSLGTTYWWVVAVEGDKPTVHLGLLKICVDDSCKSYNDYKAFSKVQDKLMTVVGLLVGAMVLDVFGLVVMAHCGLTRTNITTKNHSRLTLFLCGVAGCLDIAGVAYFVDQTDIDDVATYAKYDYGYSLHLAWLSALVAFAGGAVSVTVVNRFYWGSGRPGIITSFPGQAPAIVQTMSYPAVQVVSNPQHQLWTTGSPPPPPPQPPQQQYPTYQPPPYSYPTTKGY